MHKGSQHNGGPNGNSGPNGASGSLFSEHPWDHSCIWCLMGVTSRGG